MLTCHMVLPRSISHPLFVHKIYFFKAQISAIFLHNLKRSGSFNHKKENVFIQFLY